LDVWTLMRWTMAPPLESEERGPTHAREGSQVTSQTIKKPSRSVCNMERVIRRVHLVHKRSLQSSEREDRPDASRMAETQVPRRPPCKVGGYARSHEARNHRRAASTPTHCPLHHVRTLPLVSARILSRPLRPQQTMRKRETGASALLSKDAPQRLGCVAVR